MRRLLASEYLSLDGVLQAPGRQDEDDDGGFPHGGWTGPQMQDHQRLNSVSFQRAGAFLFGRRTYEIFAQYWPTVTDKADLIARALNTRPKYVASRSLPDTGTRWAGTALIRDGVREVAALKEEPGPPVYLLGSSGLARALMQHDLIDEYELLVHPVVLGRGKRLFPDGAPRAALRLTGCRPTGSGMVVLTYERAR